MADLYQMKSLHSSCGKLIRRNLNTVKKDAKWLELKKKAPELAFSILEEFEEENENGNDMHFGRFPIPARKTKCIKILL
jgi:uncharacterized protein with ATP-grasp and redox domains